jgi:hypothetical protein
MHSGRRSLTAADDRVQLIHYISAATENSEVVIKFERIFL